MACTKPIKAWKYGLHDSGKPKLVFKDPKDQSAQLMGVPCGKCISCKLDYAREWATRITHESQMAKVSCFLTLTISPDELITKGFTRKEKQKDGTYSDIYYPGSSVWKRSLQLFLKRLRKHTAIQVGKKKVYQKMLYLGCGEYGSLRTRPHYHIILIGYDFMDKYYWNTTGSGEDIYRSETLEKLWPYGYSSIGEVNFQSASYVARYCMKKQKDKSSYQFVDGYDEETGEIFVENLNPEFLIMSKGIGKGWWQKYKQDTDKDYLLVDYDKKVKIPRYYDKLREQEDPESLKEIKQNREKQAILRERENTYQRKHAKRIVKQTQSNFLHRELEQ